MMQKSIKSAVFAAVLMLILFVLSGCAGFYAINIRTNSDLSSILAGGSLALRSSGRDIVWEVSSTSDGFGGVANGTYISTNGLLSASINEQSLYLYVIARSMRDGYAAVKQIRVVTVNAVSVTPVNQVISLGRSAQFKAQVIGNNNPDSVVTWKVSSNAEGTGYVTQGTSISANGTLTVAMNETFRTLYVVASSVVDSSKSGSAPVSIVVPTVTGISVTPINQTIRAGSAMQFRASVIGTYEPSQAVTWQVSSNAAGTGAVTPGTSIDLNGILTAAYNESLTTLYVIATSIYDPTKSGSVPVAVVRPIVTSVIVSPSNQVVMSGGSIQFIAQITGTNNPSTAVAWSVSSNAAGTGAVTPGTSINANGLLTVSHNETSQFLYVFATSIFDPGKSGSVYVTVSAQAAAIPSPAPAPTPIPTPTPRPPTITPTTPTTPTPPTPTPRPPAPTPTPPTPRPPTTTPAPTPRPPTTTPTPTPTPRPPTTEPTPRPPTITPTPPTTTPPVSTTPTVTSVIISPATHSMKTNETRQFSASVIGTNNPAASVTWRVTPNSNGSAGNMAPNTSINANGLLRVAPNEWATHLYVFATSTVDTLITAMATVTITNNNSNSGPNQGQGN